MKSAQSPPLRQQSLIEYTVCTKKTHHKRNTQLLMPTIEEENMNNEDPIQQEQIHPLHLSYIGPELVNILPQRHLDLIQIESSSNNNFEE